jgi:hypothetical protein
MDGKQLALALMPSQDGWLQAALDLMEQGLLLHCPCLRCCSFYLSSIEQIQVAIFVTRAVRACTCGTRVRLTLFLLTLLTGHTAVRRRQYSAALDAYVSAYEDLHVEQLILSGEGQDAQWQQQKLQHLVHKVSCSAALAAMYTENPAHVRT